MSLEQGRIVVARVCDPQGRNEKDRYLVIVSETSVIESGKSFWSIAITGTLPNPMPADYVPLPWQNPRHPMTGLSKRCAAVCTWPVKLSKEQIIRECGVVPPDRMAQIRQKIGSLSA